VIRYTVEEILESVECARIKVYLLQRTPGGGAAARAIAALADSVEALARIHEGDRRRQGPDRRAPDRRTASLCGQGRRRTDKE
jgi:hypothetical protein